MQNRFCRKTLFLILFFTGTKLFSQTYSNNPSSIVSLTAGITSTHFIEDTASLKSGISLSAGVNYSLMLNNRLNVSVELLYEGRTVKKDSPVIKYRYFFVELPLFLQIKLGENLRINAGAQYAIAANSQIVILKPSNANGIDVSNMPNIKPDDYGFLFGAEADITQALSLGVRYTFSGSAIFEMNKINFGVFQLSFKYSPIKTYKVFFHHKEIN